MAHISSRLMLYRWDDNRLRTYLEEKGIIKTKQQATRDELLAKMRETYAATANPVWQAWSDSYLVSSRGLECIALKLIVIGVQHNWLVDHGLIRSDAQKTRDELAASMHKYYYNTKVSYKCSNIEADS